MLPYCNRAENVKGPKLVCACLGWMDAFGRKGPGFLTDLIDSHEWVLVLWMGASFSPWVLVLPYPRGLRVLVFCAPFFADGVSWSLQYLILLTYSTLLSSYLLRFELLNSRRSTWRTCSERTRCPSTIGSPLWRNTWIR